MNHRDTENTEQYNNEVDRVHIFFSSHLPL